MANLRVVQSKCPACGANLEVPPGIPQVLCRYCQTVIQVENRKPPPQFRAFGTPGGAPSTTLYVDPTRAGGRLAALGILMAVGIPILIPLCIFVLPWAFGTCKGLVKPFPASCGYNDELTLSGNWEGTAPAITSAKSNCKIHIKNSKIKTTQFIKGDIANVELTFENVTIETTDTMFATSQSSGLKVHLINSTLTSQGLVFDMGANVVVEAEGSTIESKTLTAVKSKSSSKFHLTNSKVRGVKSAFDTDSGFELILKKGSEVTASEGPAIKTTSSAKIESEGGKIDGVGGGIVCSSSLTITGSGLTISSTKNKAIATSSNFKLDLTDSLISSPEDTALEGEGSWDIALTNTTIQGTVGIETKSSLKIKATKKSRIIGSTGYGVLGSSSMDINLTDASIEGGTFAVRGTSSVKVKMGANSRIVGKRGGIQTESSFTIDATSASIEGGAGPAVLTTSNATIGIRQSVLKGHPAIQTDYATTSDLTGTRVEGEVTVKPRQR